MSGMQAARTLRESEREDDKAGSNRLPSGQTRTRRQDKKKGRKKGNIRRRQVKKSSRLQELDVIRRAAQKRTLLKLQSALLQTLEEEKVEDKSIDLGVVPLSQEIKLEATATDSSASDQKDLNTLSKSEKATNLVEEDTDQGGIILATSQVPSVKNEIIGAAEKQEEVKVSGNGGKDKSTPPEIERVNEATEVNLKDVQSNLSVENADKNSGKMEERKVEVAKNKTEINTSGGNHVGEESSQTKQEQEKSSQPKKGGFLSSFKKLFQKKQKSKSQKKWKAVPGARPSGPKDEEYWKEFNKHFEQKIEEDAKTGNGVGSSYWARFNMATACDCRGKHDAAINHYAAAVKMRPDKPEMHYRLGVLKKHSRSNDSVALRSSSCYSGVNYSSHFLRTVEEDPSHSGALFELGVDEKEKGNVEEAIKFLRASCNGSEYVPAWSQSEYLGAPSAADAKACLGNALSLRATGNEADFSEDNLRTCKGAFTPSKFLDVKQKDWDEAKDLFLSLERDHDKDIYFPPLISHMKSFPDIPDENITRNES